MVYLVCGFRHTFEHQSSIAAAGEQFHLHGGFKGWFFLLTCIVRNDWVVCHYHHECKTTTFELYVLYY